MGSRGGGGLGLCGLGGGDLGIECGGGGGLGGGGLGGLLLLDQCLDVGVDAVESALVLAGQGGGLVLCAGQAVERGGLLCLLLFKGALRRLKLCLCRVVVVTLPVAIAEYSERTPLVLTFDVNIWVTWLLVPLLV